MVSVKGPLQGTFRCLNLTVRFARLMRLNPIIFNFIMNLVKAPCIIMLGVIEENQLVYIGEIAGNP